MAALNKAMLIGNLGKDPKINVTNSGGKVATFSIATSESWKDKATGERKERTEWHNVVVFNEGLGKVAEQYLHKGSKVFVEGELRTRKWTDQAGAERWTTEIVLSQYRGQLILLDKSDRPAPNEADYGSTKPATSSAAAPGGAGGDLDDDIPF
jgi:single-strand DNA-binding protein